MAHRFYTKEEIPSEGMFIVQDEAIAHQISRVLKIKTGETVVFFNSTGFDYAARLERVSPRFVSVKLIEKRPNMTDSKLEVHLHQALIKKDKFEWVLEKGTEVGVKFFHPAITERAVKTGFKMERAKKIVREATEQSGQDRIPMVFEATLFKDLIASLGRDAPKILFDPNGKVVDFHMHSFTHRRHNESCTSCGKSP
ncbi:MAG: 16S rRNA (uracil(1498)-N(3))-methyltransferase [Candidatus Sungbacteria bacterium]|nr:16S rRNA (uracil(1498)-N(3))-methyltransferase [Candidatus Sungbacteria bacterium]